MSLGSNLKRLRETLGYSQDYVANKLGMSRQRYAHYENDLREPTLEILKNISSFYKVSIDELLSNDASGFNVKEDLLHKALSSKNLTDEELQILNLLINKALK